MDVKACSLMVRRDSGWVVIAVCDGGTGRVPAEKEDPTRKYTGCALPVHNILTQLLKASLELSLIYLFMLSYFNHIFQVHVIAFIIQPVDQP